MSSLSSRSLIPIITKSFLNSSCNFIKTGFAFKQGKQPRYQKSSKTTFPFKSVNVTVLPLFKRNSLEGFIFACAIAICVAKKKVNSSMVCLIKFFILLDYLFLKVRIQFYGIKRFVFINFKIVNRNIAINR